MQCMFSIVALIGWSKCWYSKVVVMNTFFMDYYWV